MKKLFFVALLATMFFVPAFCQTETDAEDDKAIVVIDESCEVIDSEREEIQSILAGVSASTIVYDDNCGSVIFKTSRGKYGYINIRTSKKLLFEGQDFIETVDITGCGLAEGIVISKDNKFEVYTTTGNLLIPSTAADGVIEVMRNPFKTAWGYAIIQRGTDFYATSTAGKVQPLEGEKCAFGINMIFTSIGDDIYVYTPDGSEKEEFLFNLNDKGVEYTEVEVLETNGQGRYEYDGKKYNNISPGIILKKGNSYILYPGGNKLSVHKSGESLIGKSGTKRVIFSPSFDTPEVAGVLLQPMM